MSYPLSQQLSVLWRIMRLGCGKVSGVRLVLMLISTDAPFIGARLFGSKLPTKKTKGRKTTIVWKLIALI